MLLWRLWEGSSVPGGVGDLTLPWAVSGTATTTTGVVQATGDISLPWAISATAANGQLVGGGGRAQALYEWREKQRQDRRERRAAKVAGKPVHAVGEIRLPWALGVAEVRNRPAPPPKPKDARDAIGRLVFPWAVSGSGFDPKRDEEEAEALVGRLVAHIP